MISLLLVGTLVFQNGDTLQFVENDHAVETVVYADSTLNDSLGTLMIRRARVADDNRFFLVYEARQRGDDEVLSSRIAFYDAGKNLLFEETGRDARNISFELSGIDNGRFIVATWDKHCGNPGIFVLSSDVRTEIIKEGDWDQVLDHVISPNGRYFLFHARNPYGNKIWDYIYFYDFSTGATWDYLLPVCASCRRMRVGLGVDDDGRSEVTYSTERRVFSGSGELLDISVGIW